jgi:hypothetical protein
MQVYATIIHFGSRQELAKQPTSFAASALVISALLSVLPTWRLTCIGFELLCRRVVPPGRLSTCHVASNDDGRRQYRASQRRPDRVNKYHPTQLQPGPLQFSKRSGSNYGNRNSQESYRRLQRHRSPAADQPCLQRQRPRRQGPQCTDKHHDECNGNGTDACWTNSCRPNMYNLPNRHDAMCMPTLARYARTFTECSDLPSSPIF